MPTADKAEVILNARILEMHVRAQLKLWERSRKNHFYAQQKPNQSAQDEHSYYL